MFMQYLLKNKKIEITLGVWRIKMGRLYLIVTPSKLDRFK